MSGEGCKNSGDTLSGGASSNASCIEIFDIEATDIHVIRKGI